MPEAFVIMPFSPQFSGIYDRFIKDTLCESGYSTSRADDIENSRNIIADIVTLIGRCDLIVADLTGTNPNVYYELGLAHALKKPVIMLAQDIDEIPFDLRSYRIILYTTDFIKIHEAREQLKKLAKDALTGKVEFGNPITDYLREPIKYPIRTIDLDVPAKRGIIDISADFEESIAQINECLAVVSEQFVSIGMKVSQATRSGQNQPATVIRSVLRGLAHDMNEFAKAIKREAGEYRVAIAKFEGCISDLIESSAMTQSEETADSITTFIAALSTSRSIGEESLLSVKSFQKSMEDMPNLELQFNIANDAASQEMKELIQTTEKNLSVFSRAEILCHNLLEKHSDSFDE